jgi:hypothetical protein
MAIAVTLILKGIVFQMHHWCYVDRVSVRVFTQLDTSKVKQTGRGAYTYFFGRCEAQFIASLMGVLAFGSNIYWIPLAMVLQSIGTRAKCLW